MNSPIVNGLGGGKKLLLACAGVLALTAVIAVGIIDPPGIRAQSQRAATSPKFEVASIRLCQSGAGQRVRGGVSVSPGQLQVTCLPLYNIASIAYGVDLRYPLKETGPGWIHSDPYDIEAKAQGNPSAQLMQGPMLQALLEDRFKLKIRHETREVPVYALTVAKSGFKLRPLDPGSCTPLDPLNPPTNFDDLKAAMAKTCATAGTIGLRRAPGHLVTAAFHGISLDDFAKALDRAMDRTVLNKTGIAGMFDIHMEFAPDDAVPAFMPGGRLIGFVGPASPPEVPGDSIGPSIFTAIQEQLGLRLEGGKSLADFYSIDHVERPTEN
jgi:bla regulator protein blaR1